MRWFSFSEQQETKDISFWRWRLSQLYLVFLIMLLVGNETLACGMPRLPRVTEFSAPGLAIDISIIDSAEDVDLPCWGNASGVFDGFQGAGRDVMLGDFGLIAVECENSRGCSVSSSGHCVNGMELLCEEIVWEPFAKVCWCKASEDGDVISWRFTKISDSNRHKISIYSASSNCGVYGPCFGVLMFRNQARTIKTESIAFYSDIRPQLLSGGSSTDSYLYKATYKQQNRTDAKNSGEPNHPPIGRRLVILIFGVLGGFLCCLAGIQQFDRNRRMIGVALVAFGLGGCAVGLGLWWATFSFSDTWGWFV